jgi:hypothetical protein
MTNDVMAVRIKKLKTKDPKIDEIPYAVDVKNCSSKIQWHRGGKVVE